MSVVDSDANGSADFVCGHSYLERSPLRRLPLVLRIGAAGGVGARMLQHAERVAPVVDSDELHPRKSMQAANAQRVSPELTSRRASRERSQRATHGI